MKQLLPAYSLEVIFDKHLTEQLLSFPRNFDICWEDHGRLIDERDEPSYGLFLEGAKAIEHFIENDS